MPNEYLEPIASDVLASIFPGQQLSEDQILEQSLFT
jgi:hypothetical protein